MAGRGVPARADDSKLVRLLFDDTMKEALDDQWELKSIICDYYDETQVVLEDDDRVDLLAKGRSGEKTAIELKIVEARQGATTQLTSYMGNLESSGVPADKIRGILVAPGFSQKVLNSAAIEPRITLLRFDRVP